MRLSDLLKFDSITIQCHDNPDPDALASAYGLYLYFKDNNKDTKIIYGGRGPIQKANLKLMVDTIGIPAEYRTDKETPMKGLLITADCQYGEGNTTPFKADAIAIIDHHNSASLVKADMDMTEIHSYLGSCSTLVWKMLNDENVPVKENKKLCTALYYGLMTDTGNFVEIHHPLDRDMMDDLVYDKMQISKFCNSNISLDELKIAGVALMEYKYNADYKYTIIHSEPCDPNILGLISDLALQVDVVDSGVVFNETQDGYKFSVRSCTKEVHANDLAEFLAKDIGSGGGHTDKAGGFLSKSKLQRDYANMAPEDYFNQKLSEYFKDTMIIWPNKYQIDTSDMKRCVKKRIIIGYADPLEFLNPGEAVTIRTLEGDIDVTVEDDFYIMIGIQGEVYPMKKEKFNKAYDIVDDNYEIETEYMPTIRKRADGTTFNIAVYAHSCRAKGVSYVLAKETKQMIKIFTTWDEDNYYLGKPGDYIACKEDDLHDIYIIQRGIFEKTYEEV